MKTPKDLMNYLVDVLNFPLCTVCELHKPCAIVPRCSLDTSKRFVNFDEVKTEFCKKHKMESCSSVDGLSAKNDSLLFVEIKGWADFLKYQTQNAEQKVQKQVMGYDFVKKLQDSIGICNDYTSDNDFCNREKIAYLIVTDIDTKQHPLQALQSNLMSLAQTSSSIENLCNKFMLEKINKIHGINTYYKQCKELDSFIDSCF